MAAIHLSQAQVEASALPHDRQLNDPQRTEDATEDRAEKIRSIVPYLLEKCPEFRELSDLRQQVNHTESKCHTHVSNHAIYRDGKPWRAKKTLRTFVKMRTSPTKRQRPTFIT